LSAKGADVKLNVSMKKKMILVGIIATIGLGSFFASCKKDDKVWNGCSCGMAGVAVKFDAATLKSQGITDCNDASREFSQDGVTVTCTDL